MARTLFLAILMVIIACVTLPDSATAQNIIDDNDRIVLPGNVHHKARPESDLGAAEDDLPMKQMTLTIRRSPEKKADLDRLLAEQHDPASPNYRRWLTPDQFGSRFGLSRGDTARVTGWLKSHGFTVESVSRSGGWINFSGSAGMVKKAFRTEIHNYAVDGKIHHANSGDPSIPRALAGVVDGIATLHDFRRKPLNQGLTPVALGDVLPQYTDGSYHAISPGDFATIYNVKPLYSAGIDGTGATIAVVGRTNPPSSNWSSFRSLVGLPVNPPQVIVNGTDPGSVSDDENFEADLDVEWAGAIAKNATVKFVTSRSTFAADGVDLSAQYIVDNNLADVITTSFGLCEAAMGSSERSFYNNLWAQAAAQGMTSFVASGDSGVAGCDDAGSSAGTVASVNGLASTPYNVAVGGTQFDDGAGGYWGATWQNVDYASALGYIPEISWNQSGNVSGGGGLWATGGGASSVYAKPSWQVAPGVPADGKRSVPDVSLTAATHDPYLIRSKGAFYSIGGTSASTPAFASIMALVVQKTGQRQGNANPRFYQLAVDQYAGSGAAVYHDIVSGNNSVPGVSGYSCTQAYDLATGLGSVDVTSLVSSWDAAPSFSIYSNVPSLNVVKGGDASASITVLNNQNKEVTLSVSGLPAGASALLSPASIAAPGSGSSILSVTASGETPVGSYPITVTADNGTASTSVTLTLIVAGGADLRVAAVSGSIASGVLSYSVTVHNQGDTAAAPSTTRISLSADGIDKPVTTVSTAGIAAGAEVVLSGSAALSPDFTPGTYQVVGQADAAGVIIESDEGNNRSASGGTVTLSNDLTLSALSGSVSGGKISYSVTVSNSGTGNPLAPVTLYFSSDGVATTSDYVITSIASTSVAGGSSATLTGSVAIPGGVPSGDYYLVALADPGNRVIETNEANNAATGTRHTVGSDLEISAFTASLAAGKVSYSVTVRNNGTIASASSGTGIYLSAGGTDTLITTLSTASIAAGGQLSLTGSVSLPATMAPGTYAVVAVADTGRAAVETDETNNRAVASGSVTVSNDLSVSALSGSLSAGKLTYSVTVVNSGSGNPSVPVSLYFSADASAATSDYLITNASAVSIPGGSSKTYTGTVAVPGTVPSGTWYLVALADPAKAILEADESNNGRAASQFTVGSDLQIGSVSGYLASGKLNYSVTVSNAGNIAAAASNTGIYLSAAGKDTAISSVSTASIAAGAQVTLTGSVALPASLPPATYSLVAVADSSRAVAESDELDNRAVSATTLTVNNDLTLSALSGTLSSGKLTYTVTVANSGSGNPSAPVSLYFSLDGTAATSEYLIVKTGTVSIPGGTTKTISGTATVPATPSGTYYLVALADPANGVPETMESNNGATATRFSVGSDLHVGALSGSLASGKLSYSMTLQNRGNIASGASTTGIYLSAGGKDTLISPVGTANIAAGGELVLTGSITLPATVPSGSYTLVAVADSNGVVAETDETDNRTAAAGSVTVSNDLTLGALSGTLSSGKMTYSVTVSNSGNGNATVPVYLYFSTDGNATTSDYLIGQSKTVTVAGGSSVILTGTVTVPGTVPSGSYNLVALADPANGVIESSESNNGAAGGVFAVGSDLRIAALSGSLAAGKVSYSVTVQNTGNIAAAASTTGLYLSSGGVDTPISSINTASIPAGSQLTLSGSVAVPSTLRPGSYAVVAVADSKGGVFESDESDNRGVAATTVALSNDLTVTALSGTLSAGKLTYTVTLANSGTGNPTVPVSLYFSVDGSAATSDYQISKLSAVSIPGGTSKTSTGTVTVPGTVPSGTFYLVALADPDNGTIESNESNNGRAATQFTVGSDLQVGAVSGSVASGKLTYTVTVNNAGNIAAAASTTAVYLSGGGKEYLITNANTVSIAAGGQVTVSGTVTIPTTVPAGTYSVVAVADSKLVVSEANEANNRGVSLLTVTR